MSANGGRRAPAGVAAPAAVRRSSAVTASLSREGGRAVNQDACGQRVLPHAACWVVADGLGGHGGGEIAARLAVDAAIESFVRNPSVTRAAIVEHFQAAQDALLKRVAIEPGLASMRTTLVVLVCDYTMAIWGSVGDSRLYHFRDGRLAAQTRDHSVPQTLADAGSIPHSEIRRHPDRSRLTRAVGGAEGQTPSGPDAPMPLGTRDAFLLCVDGFWEHVLEPEMEIDLAKSKQPEAWLETMEDRLLARVTGDHDNCTAVAVLLSRPGVRGGDALLAAAPVAEPRRADAADSAPLRLLATTLLVLVAVLAIRAAHGAGVLLGRAATRVPKPAASAPGEATAAIASAPLPLPTAPRASAPAPPSAPALASAPAASAPPATLPLGPCPTTGVSTTRVRAVQVRLLELQLDIGGSTADGAFGPGTCAGLREFQSRVNLPPSGALDAATCSALFPQAGTCPQ